MTNLNFIDPNSSGNPAVLLLHGLGADSSSWTLQMRPLIEAGFRPIAVDTPGFGGSPYDGHGWSIRRMAVEMAGLLDALQIVPAHVVGLSMGGTIAQQLALDFPHLVQRLVLASTFTILRPDKLNGWLYFLQRLFVVYTLGLPAQAKIVARRLFPNPCDVPLRDILVNVISHANPNAYRKAMLSLGLFNSKKRLWEIKMPTLVVTGENDTTVSPARQKLLVEGIPGSLQVVILGAGHAVSVDQPEAFNRELIKFLKGN